MDWGVNIKVVFAVLSFAALSLLTVSEFRRRNGNRKSKCCNSSCYLQSQKGKTQKPQLTFKRVLADNSYSQFKHLKKFDQSSNEISHPYASEINALLGTSPLTEDELDFGANFDRISDECENYVWVDSGSKLEELANVLNEETAFAVDTEQHSLRSFLGFTALVQISTTKKDYLIDTIAVHDEMNLLAPVFANPKICKVFHGADNDCLWLQRDFHIYVVNLFDTSKACEVLSKPQKSLAYLLESYCGVFTDKSFQRVDWSQRPLSRDMIHYARSDAHFLLYIASRLVAELKQLSSGYLGNSSDLDRDINFLNETCRRSNLISLQLYSKEIEYMPGELAASSIISRHIYGHEKLSLLKDKQDLIRRICMWRELMARIHDESIRYVLSDQAIVLISLNVPKTEQDLCETLAQTDMDNDHSNNHNVSQSPSPTVCSHLSELLSFIHRDIDYESAFWFILDEHLGPHGRCPMSIYNYALIFNNVIQLKGNSVHKQNLAKISKQNIRKASRDLFVKKFSCKAPVYHNCRIFANDGRLLCYCDRRKLEWYLHRNLAKLVDENPPAIELLFEPKGRPEDEGNDFYIHSKKNICVCCGEGSHYLRYRIIPSCYRMHFPEHLKSHRSHDIVLLCVDCHEVAHAAAEKHKKRIAEEFEVPLFLRKFVALDGHHTINWEDSLSTQEDESEVSPLKLRTAAVALLRHGSRMPMDRRMKLTQIVNRYFGGKELTVEDLERAIVVGMSPHERKKFAKKRGRFLKLKLTDDSCDSTDMSKGLEGAKPTIAEETNGELKDCCGEDEMGGNASASQFQNTMKASLLGHGPHGKQVVSCILREQGEDGLRLFCQTWRQVFVDATQPRFLPSGWDVMHSGRRDFGEFSVYNPANKTSQAS